MTVENPSALCLVDHRTATTQCAAVLEREFRAGTKISCETVLAEIFEMNKGRHRDASRSKARSHCAVAAPS
jgi:hypothetical protein